MWTFARLVRLINIHLLAVLPRRLWFLARGHQAPEHLLVQENANHLSQERGVGLHVIDDVNLVEENTRVEDVESRIIDGTSEYDVLQEL